MQAKASSLAPRFTLILVLELALKDWLLSTRQPYPYESSLLLTVLAAAALKFPVRTSSAGLTLFAASCLAILLQPTFPIACLTMLLPFVVALGVSTAENLPKRFVAVSGLVLVAALASGTYALPVLFSALVVAAIAQNRSHVAQILALAAAATVWTYHLWPSHWSMEIDAWIGSGFATTDSTVPLADALAKDWGLLANVVLILGLLASTIAAKRALSAENGVARRQLIASGFGLLTGIALMGRTWNAMLTESTPAGTIVFLSGMGLLVAGLTDSSPPPQKVRSSRKRLPLAVAVVVAFAAVGLGMVRASMTVGELLSAPLPKNYIPIDRISPQFLDATVAMEDGIFYRHHGFDFAAMHRALRINLREGRVAQGGSTLSQQLAKNLFLTNDRTFWRKIQEAFLTIELERRLSKPQILERYVNAIDYGFGNRGINAAAKFYFRKPPRQLTFAEATTLVGLVPSPPTDRLELGKLEEGRETGLRRTEFFFPGKYAGADYEAAKSVSMSQLIYPLKNAWDRHVTDEMPDVVNGVTFYFDLSPTVASGLGPMHQSLKRRLEGFLREAKAMHIDGLDHIGIFNDRFQRGSNDVLSAHAFGQAIDISGFRFANGDHLRVEDHGDVENGKQLLKIEAVLRRHFDVVVDWRQDPARHDNHFHAEVKGPRVFPNRAPQSQPHG